MLVEDLLEGHFTVQLAVQGDEDRAQAPLRMRSKNAEPQAVAGGRGDGIAGRAAGVVILAGRRRADADQASFDGGLAYFDQAMAS